MIEALLNLAFRLAPEPYAERISLLISGRRCQRRWAAMERAAIARGAAVVTIADSAGSSTYILER